MVIRSNSLQNNMIYVLCFSDAVNGHNITECWSLAGGLVTPCPQSAFNSQCNSVQCPKQPECGRCPSGKCDVASSTKSVCDNNPCQNGATCVPFSGSEYICLCPFRRHGHFCERCEYIKRTINCVVNVLYPLTHTFWSVALDVQQPSFAGTLNGESSFLAYALPDAMLAPAFELSLKIIPRTQWQIALLVFVGQGAGHDERSAHFAVSFVQGEIRSTCASHWPLMN